MLSFLIGSKYLKEKNLLFQSFNKTLSRFLSGFSILRCKNNFTINNNKIKKALLTGRFMIYANFYLFGSKFKIYLMGASVLSEISKFVRSGTDVQFKSNCI